MKTLVALLLAAVILAPVRAAEGADEQAPAAGPSTPAPEQATMVAGTPEEPPPPRSLFYEGTHFGLQLDAGVPAGVGVQLVGRPWKFLRLSLGPAHNVLGLGAKGGITLIPFHWYVTPTLSVEAGRFFPADASRFVKDADPSAIALLSRVGYDYLSADLGLEFGAENRFVFFLRAGLSELRPTVGDVNAALRASDPTLRVTASQPAIRGRIPAVRLGFLVYVF